MNFIRNVFRDYTLKIYYHISQGLMSWAYWYIVQYIPYVLLCFVLLWLYNRFYVFLCDLYIYIILRVSVTDTGEITMISPAPVN